MDYRNFNAKYNSQCHNKWLANILNMSINHTGPDLTDNLKYVEVKNGQSPNNWTLVGEKQINYLREYPDKPHFLALLLYSLSQPIDQLKNGIGLEGKVRHRSVIITPLDWISQFEVKNGELNTYVYPNPRKGLKIKIKRRFKVKKGFIYLEENVDMNLFPNARWVENNNDADPLRSELDKLITFSY